MSRFSKVLVTVGFIVAVLLVGVAVGWLATRKSASNPQLSATAVSNNKSQPSSRVPFFPTNSRAHRPESGIIKAASPPAATRTNLIVNWEEKIEEILGAEGDEAGKAKQMLALFPRLPEDGQVEVAQHLSNLLSDEDYAPLGKLLTDPQLPEDVLDVLLVDVLNRPNGLKLPLLLNVAREPQHPKASEAKDLLELYLEEDYGNDWNKWQAKLDQWIKDNPD